jgi:hypothetical protein
MCNRFTKARGDGSESSSSEHGCTECLNSGSPVKAAKGASNRDEDASSYEPGNQIADPAAERDNKKS